MLNTSHQQIIYKQRVVCKYTQMYGFFPLIFHPFLPQAPQSLFISKRGWSGNRHIYHIPGVSVLFLFSFFGFRVQADCSRQANLQIRFSDFRESTESKWGSVQLEPGVCVSEDVLSHPSSRLCGRALLLRCTCSCAAGQLAWLGRY